MKKLLFIIIVSLAAAVPSLAQKENINWYFGSNAGVTFASGSPVAVTNGAMSAVEGCAAISDSAGNLLFYTNGESIWNRNHLLMPNANGTLNGSNAATQNAIIVPKPNDPNRYYIFTVDHDGGANGLSYSEVDMTQAGGLGDVVTLNISLLPSITEKVTATLHDNYRDYWVITHGWNNNEFDAFLITPSGVNPVPVVSSIGTTHGGSNQNSHGYMKVSTDGTKVGVAVTGNTVANTFAEVFDFNNITGVVSNPINFSGFFAHNLYGLEFSPDSRVMYVATSSNPHEIHQFDLYAGSVSQIVQSGQVPVESGAGFVYALQLAIDGKIYGSRAFKDSLAVINNPNTVGAGCGFVLNAISLAGQTAQGGLPNLIQRKNIVANYTYADTCLNNATQFTLDFAGIADSVHWDFDDPSSGINNLSTDTITSHVFTAPGNYDVKLIVFVHLITDTVIKTIHVLPLPSVKLGNDTSLCTGQSIQLYAGPVGTNSYLWQDNAITNTYVGLSPGTYTVTVTTPQGCSSSDTIVISGAAQPIVNLGRDTSLCETNAPYILSAQNAGAAYLWNNGTTAQTLSVNTTGYYSVTVTSNGCTGADTVFVNVVSSPLVVLGNDTTLCDGIWLYFNVTNDSSQYLWNDGYTGSTRYIDTLGTYAVTVTNNHGCSSYDAVNIDLQFEPHVYLGEDTVLCSGQPLTLDATNYGASYQWQDGSTKPTFIPTHTDIYGVSATNQCGIATDSISVEIRDCNCLVYFPKSFTPNADNKNDVFNYKYDCNQFLSYLRIWNRIGQLMFVSENPDIGWDGLYNGKPAAEGVYVYQLHYSGYGDGKLDEQTQRGTFLLLR